MLFQRVDSRERTLKNRRRMLRDFPWLWAVSPSVDTEHSEYVVHQGRGPATSVLIRSGARTNQLFEFWFYSETEYADGRLRADVTKVPLDGSPDIEVSERVRELIVNSGARLSGIEYLVAVGYHARPDGCTHTRYDIYRLQKGEEMLHLVFDLASLARAARKARETAAY